MGLAFGRVTVYQRVRLCLNCDAVFRKNLLITFLQDRIINMVRLTLPNRYGPKRETLFPSAPSLKVI